MVSLVKKILGITTGGMLVAALTLFGIKANEINEKKKKQLLKVWFQD